MKRHRRFPVWLRVLFGIAALYALLVGVQAADYGVSLLRTRRMTSEQVLRFYLDAWRANDLSALAAAMWRPENVSIHAVEWNPLVWALHAVGGARSLEVRNLRAADERANASMQASDTLYSGFNGYQVYYADVTVRYGVIAGHSISADGQYRDLGFTLARASASDPWKVVNCGYG